MNRPSPTSRTLPTPPTRRALSAWLVAVLLSALLVGCLQAPTSGTSSLRIDFANQRPAIDATLALTSNHPAAAQRASHNAPVPGHYTAFDQLQQWSGEAQVPIEVSYHAAFGFFVARIAGLPESSNDAYWSLTVNGTESQVGMEQVVVVAGSRIEWRLTPLSMPDGSPQTETDLTLDAPVRVETRASFAFVNGTTTPGALVLVRGGPGSPAVSPTGSWSYRIEPRHGHTPLSFVADDGKATRHLNVTVVRLAAATLNVTYTMAVPAHSASLDVVWYDPDERASAPMYGEKGTGPQAFATVHDLLVTWTRQTGTPITYSHSASFGFGVEAIDGVGAPLSNGTPPYWCYKLNGEPAGLGISLQAVAPGDVVAWDFGGCM